MLTVRQYKNRHNRIKNKYKAKDKFSSSQRKYLDIMKKRQIPAYVLEVINKLNENCDCKVALTGSFKWGYWVDSTSNNFQLFMHKLVTGKDKLSDIDVEFVTDPCPEMYKRVKSLADFNIEIVTNPHSHASL